MKGAAIDISQDAVALTEGPSATIFSGESNCSALSYQRPKSTQFRKAPIDGAFASQAQSTLELLLQLRVQVELIGSSSHLRQQQIQFRNWNRRIH